MRVMKVTMAALLGATMATACARPNEMVNDDAAPPAPIGVHVQNQNFNDVNVYALSGGMARRLGTVYGSGSETFSLEPSYATRPLAIVAVPIGGWGRASSGELNVMAGDTVDFRIAPRLAGSGVLIR